ncbi:MAG: membrane protein insertase YidC [Gammaproteobacteria bacterium]
MENKNIVLFFILSFGLLLVWQVMQEDMTVAPVASTEQTEQAPVSAPPVQEDIPSTSPPVSSASSIEQSPLTEDVLASGKRIHIKTDVLDIELDTLGGDFRKANLLAYPIKVDEPDKPVKLLEDGKKRLFIAQSGLISDSAPDHHAVFTAEQESYNLGEDANELRVPLTWKDSNGVTVVKTYILHRDSYLIDVEQKVVNESNQPWKGYQYQQMQRTRPGEGEKPAFIYTYTGGVIYSEEEKYEKIEFDDMADENLSRDIKGGWAAMIEHYFLGAWIPNKEESFHYYSKALDSGPFVLGMVSPEKLIDSGNSATFGSQFYVGPKDQERLEQVAQGLTLTVDYGFLTIIAHPIFVALKYIHKMVGNWGWAIIIITLFIKLLFYKLSEKSYRSMANMRRLQPKMTALRERYGDDRQKMSQAMMEMYKKEKINPLGGCLPMLVQIPVFISLYWVLLESVEMRQAEFMFWLTDLSSKDPYYILPLLMGASMFIQQKLNPAPPDPVQAKVMMALPVIFTAFFAFFPSGLVLYWTVNSILSILQQWVITRRIENAAK